MTTDKPTGLADPAGSYANALDATRKFVAGMRNVDWVAATPCSDWNVRELLQHVLYGTAWIEDVFAGKTVEDVGTKYDGDLIGDDALASYDAVVASAKAAIAKPGAMDQVGHLRRGDVAGRDYLTSMFTDSFIHGWDLAKATGQDATLDPALVATAFDLAKEREERFRTSPAFGQGRVADPGDDAPSQTRLLSILGRDADWTA
ncbi:MAG: TIGR03086 family metal-binding protein [Chloroflexi bacterium]|nr:TIGR03086 family metal-binding protein [Chloroflexota bacterium]